MPQKKRNISEILSDDKGDTNNALVSLSSLNFDCLQHIFKYLPIKDRIAVERVSKQWNCASKSSWGNFKSLNFDTDVAIIEKKCDSLSIQPKLKVLESVLSRCGKFLKSLNLLKYIHWELDFEETSYKLFFKAVTHCSNLKSLTLPDHLFVDKVSIPTLKVIIKNIQKLQCKLAEDVTDEDLKLLFSSCKDLEDLCILVGDNITGDFLHFLKHEKIKVLDLSRFTSANAMYHALQKCENLENLTIYGLTDDINFESNFECPKKLESLYLSENDYPNLSLISNMTSLLRLQLFDTVMTDSLLFKIAKNCSELQFLELCADPGTDYVTDRGIQALASLSKLKVLRLAWLSITGNSLKQFSTLQKLAVSAISDLDKRSLYDVLVTCKELKELSINSDYDDSNDDCKSAVIDFFTFAKKALEQRHLINKKPLRIELTSCFVIVTSNFVASSEKVNLFFELYERSKWQDEKSQKVLGTNDLSQLISELNCNDYFSIF